MKFPFGQLAVNSSYLKTRMHILMIGNWMYEFINACANVFVGETMQKCSCGAYVMVPGRYIICTACGHRVFSALENDTTLQFLSRGMF
jgi:hypothetical protein